MTKYLETAKFKKHSTILGLHGNIGSINMIGTTPRPMKYTPTPRATTPRPQVPRVPGVPVRPVLPVGDTLQDEVEEDDNYYAIRSHVQEVATNYIQLTPADLTRLLIILRQLFICFGQQTKETSNRQHWRMAEDDSLASYSPTTL
eukprot:557409-Amphidinium_carterae.1